MRTVPTKRMSLLTEREAQLVLSSAPRNLVELTPRELRNSIQRARRLMGKYEDQAKSQRREARGTKVPTRSRRAQGNTNTRRKAEYFAVTLERFEKRLALLEKKKELATRAAKARTTRTTTRTTRRTTTRAASPTRKRAQPRRATKTQKRSGALAQKSFPAMKRQAHASARGRRTQARRDQRRAAR